MTPNIFIILVCRNNLADLQRLLPLIAKEAKVVIVDNGSTDSTAKVVREQYEAVFVIENKANNGFVKGVNIGLTFAFANRASHVMLLSPFISAMSDQAITVLLDKRAEIISPVIVVSAPDSAIYIAGGRLSSLLLRPQLNELSQKPPVSFNTAPQFILGDAMLIYKKVVMKIGLLNEQFTDQYGIIDYCLRAKAAGFRLSIQPKSTVTLTTKSHIGLSNNIDDYVIFCSKYPPKVPLIRSIYTWCLKLGLYRLSSK